MAYKNRDFYFLMGLKDGSEKSVLLGCSQVSGRAVLFSEAPGKDLFVHCFFQLLLTAGIPWLASVAFPTLPP